jgi:head-tail adaptor
MTIKASKRPSAGQRDTWITIQRPTETKGTSGEPIETWTTLCRLCAFQEPVDAPERFTEGVVMDQISARAWIKFTAPYRSDCDPSRVDVPKARRILLDGRVYDIAAAELVGRNDQIQFLTLSKVG